MKIKVYKCDSCGFTSETPTKFREFVGNVLVPDNGGLIGNNIWTGAPGLSSWQEKRHQLHCSIQDRSQHGVVKNVEIYSLLYCTSCTMKILEL